MSNKCSPLWLISPDGSLLGTPASWNASWEGDSGKGRTSRRAVLEKARCDICWETEARVWKECGVSECYWMLDEVLRTHEGHVQSLAKAPRGRANLLENMIDVYGDSQMPCLTSCACLLACKSPNAKPPSLPQRRDRQHGRRLQHGRRSLPCRRPITPSHFTSTRNR